MKIQITNPKLVTIGAGVTAYRQINSEQLKRIIEKLLLTKSIIAENIVEVIK